MKYKQSKELKSCYMDKVCEQVDKTMKDVKQTKPKKM